VKTVRTLLWELQHARFLQSELAAELYVDEVLAGDGSLLHVDSKGSVRGLSRDEAPLVQVPEIKILSAGDPLYGA